MAKKFVTLVKNPGGVLLSGIVKFYNFVKPKVKTYASSDLKELNEIKELSLKRTDINDHLVTLFIESIV